MGEDFEADAEGWAAELAAAKDRANAGAAKVAAEWRVGRPRLRAGRPTPHSLRHTAIAHWIAAGITDKFQLRTYAGHRSIETIDRLYGHLLPRDTTDATEKMAAMRKLAREADDANPAAVASNIKRRRAR